MKPWSYGPQRVLGHLASKSNARRKTNWGGIIKSESALTFVGDFRQQVPKAKIPYPGAVALTADVWYRDRRRDLDISLLQDCIQASGIIKNDRQIVYIKARRFVDKQNPRVVFELRAIDDL